ncbi:hypothetical protein ACIPVK_03095 [Paeniglutamicibacter sp. MACA_103]|uniref:hypothetical protein n=1 Tax=Paeniglutamicibacter sp. MACA_103 TaxID=3377337 RepID=UPI003892F283
MSARGNLLRTRQLRTAAIVYAVIVVLGLGATGAHALWSLNGSVASNATAGAWAPRGVDAATVTCSRKDGPLLGDSYSDLTLNWGAVDATGYTVQAVRNSVTTTKTTSNTTATLRLDGAALLGTYVYAVTITPTASGLSGPPARVTAELSKVLLVTSVKCTPAA